MSLQPNLEEQEHLAESRRRADERHVSRDLICEIVVGVGFAGAVLALWLATPPGSFRLLPAALSWVVFLIAIKVKFETPFGFTVATQLAFVPLVFAMPGPLVPIAVAAALMVERLPGILTGHVPPDRILRQLGNSWFAIGPVAAFAIAGTSPDHAGPVLLIAALASQFAGDMVVSTLRTAIQRGATLAEQLSESWVYAIDAALSVIALVVAEDIHRLAIVALAPLPLLGLLAVFAHERAERIESLIELNTAYRGTALVLGDVIEADDGYTGEHCKSVVRLAIDVATGLGLGADERRNVEFAALLHDVGKIAIPKEIINKPGKLTPDEFKVIQTHTVEGQMMLDRIGGFMQKVGMIVRSHHERWDGGGYPDGLAGDRIPVEARIITACDSWNAMRTDRSYRKALPYETACEEMRSNAGGQFDPRIIEVLLSVVATEDPARQLQLAAATAPEPEAPAGSPEPELPQAA
jgi:putative nucleotidyltransferase with HDIG domain